MLCRPTELSFPLNDACNEDLIKKNKKRKPLGAINLRLTMSPVSKEEMNEVRTGELELGAQSGNSELKLKWISNDDFRL